MRKFYLLCYLLHCIFCTAQTKTIAIIGSSTSACYGFNNNPADNMSQLNCYVNRLITYYQTKGITINAHYRAISGTNVYNGMPDGSPPIIVNGYEYSPNPSAGITDAINSNPDAIMVNYPTNAYQYMSVEDILRYFRTIKQAANAAGKNCYITTTQPRNDFDAATRRKLMVLKDSILFQFGYSAIDFWSNIANADGTIVPVYAQPDGVHINNLGHQIFSDRVVAKNFFTMSVVPTKLLSFEVGQYGQDLKFKWSVAHERAGTVYNVQKSTDNVSFTNMKQFVASANSSKRSYEFTDRSPESGLHYFRIEIHENGRKLYSATQKINAGKNPFWIERIVNQSSETEIYLRSEEKGRIQLQLLSALGNNIGIATTHVERGFNRLVVSHAPLSPGIYWIHVNKDSRKILVRSFFAN